MKIEEKRNENTKMLKDAVKEWENSEFAKKYETDYESATFHDKEDSDSYLEVIVIIWFPEIVEIRFLSCLKVLGEKQK